MVTKNPDGIRRGKVPVSFTLDSLHEAMAAVLATRENPIFG